MNTKIPVLLLALFLVLRTYAQIKPQEGDGTIESPYQIQNIDHLEWVAENFNDSGHYILITDIDAKTTKSWNSNKGFNPLGDYFEGSFDGKGFTISNLTIKREYENGIGFINNCSGIIKNLTLTNVNIEGNRFVGGIAGTVHSSKGLINNCSVSGTIDGYENVGAIVGGSFQESNVNLCTSLGTVSGSQNIGGLVGKNSGKISLSSSNVNVTATSAAGGLVGLLNSVGLIEKSWTSGTVNAPYEAGGLVGKSSSSNTEINNCYSNSTITGETDAGGIIGENKGTVINVYYAGELSGNFRVGALIGLNQGSITGSYWDKEISQRSTSSGSFSSHGKTTLEFGEQTTFDDWDFSAIWEITTIPELSIHPKPYLKWQLDYKSIKLFTKNKIAFKSITKNNLYPQDEQVTIETEASTGFRFIGWRKDNEIISTDNPYSFIITEHLDLEAVFEEVELSFSGGEGTLESPYEITTYEELEYISHFKRFNDKHFILTSNIDASASLTAHEERGFLPIGSQNSNFFKGRFNGQGFTISNLHINRPKNDNIGLFSTPNSAIIQQLNLQNCSIKGKDNVGGITGYSYSEILNCSVTNSEISGNYYTGGLVGQNKGKLKLSYSNAEVSGKAGIGGAIGFNEGEVEQCFTTGAVSGEASIGGFAGVNYNSIKQSYAAGLVKGGNYTNGFTGNNSKNNSGIITQSYYDSQSTNQSSSGSPTGVTKLSSANFNQKHLFKEWDFNHIWKIATLTDYDSYPRPYLRSFLNEISIQLSTRKGFELEHQHEVKRFEGNGFYTPGSQATVNAIPSPGFRFEKWILNGKTISSTSQYSFTVSDIMYLEAVFQKDELSFSGGFGTKHHPFIITTLQQLEYLSNRTDLWCKHFILGADIDASATVNSHEKRGFRPIGKSIFSKQIILVISKELLMVEATPSKTSL